jgi:hypothetical protein
MNSITRTTRAGVTALSPYARPEAGPAPLRHASTPFVQRQDLPPPRASEAGAPASSLSSLAPRAATFGPAAVPLPLDRTLAAKHYPAMARYLEVLEAAYASNQPAPIRDKEFLPDLIAGLNAADPRRKLEYCRLAALDAESVCESSLVDRLSEGLGKGSAWCTLLDEAGGHRTALGIQCSSTSRDASLVLVDSLAIDVEDPFEQERWLGITQALEKALQAKLGGTAPVRLRLTVAGSDAQRSGEGCAIFAISAARKLASEPAIARLHGKVLDAIRHGMGSPGFGVLPPHLLPPAFFKHANSGRDIRDYLAARSGAAQAAAQYQGPRLVVDPIVNKKGQSLLQRHASHLVERPASVGDKMIRFSNSYEAKRIELVRVALAQLTAAKEGMRSSI